jgi:hypothetical protein
VAGVIGVAVEDDEVGLAPVQDIVFGVLFFLGLIAEEAALPVTLLDILYPPGCPDVVHYSLLAG